MILEFLLIYTIASIIIISMRIFRKTIYFILTLLKKQNPAQTNALEFTGLNPLLARQLSQLEAQVGQFTQVRFEMAQEREKMRFEMEALKTAIRQSQENPQNVPPSSLSQH